MTASFLLLPLRSKRHSGQGRVFSQAIQVDAGSASPTTGQTISTSANFQHSAAILNRGNGRFAMMYLRDEAVAAAIHKLEFDVKQLVTRSKIIARHVMRLAYVSRQLNKSLL